MKYIFCLLFFLPFKLFSQSSFNKGWINCIVQLEKELPNGSRELHGTGVGLYNYSGSFDTHIITCAHLLRNNSIIIKIPASDSAITAFTKNKIDTLFFDNNIWIFDGFNFRVSVLLKENITFIKNDTLDIGIVKMPSMPAFFINKDTIYRLSKFTSISKTFISLKNDVEVGTNIYFLGFPFSIGSDMGYYNSGLFSDKKINPLVRGGIVAWKGDQSNQFLIDGVSYGGNSGSPVFTQTQILSGKQPTLIGMVLGHLLNIQVPELDINQGLARCVWIDDILELDKKWR